MADDQPVLPGANRNWGAWTVSILNGAVGDYLRRRGNGLAVDMAFYHAGRPLTLSPAAVQAAHRQLTPRVCILVHGLGCHEAIWEYAAPDNPLRTVTYGALLQEELGFTPFYLRYNTGLAIHENGHHFAALLDTLLHNYPLPVTELLLIGHSMGGLVIRHACHFAGQQQMAWVPAVARIFYLGSPHGGAPLARFGRAATTTLHAIPNPITQLIGDVLNVRSQGIKDLSRGVQAPSDPQALPWLPTAAHFLLMGAVAETPDHPATRLLGDGLVPLAPPGATLPPDGATIKNFPRTHHLQLAHDPEIYVSIKEACRR